MKRIGTLMISKIIDMDLIISFSYRSRHPQVFYRNVYQRYSRTFLGKPTFSTKFEIALKDTLQIVTLLL